MPHVSQTDVTMSLDGVQVQDGPRPEPYWYAGQTLEICVDGSLFQLGKANGDDNNCLIDTLRQLLNERPGAFIVQGRVADVRARLEDMHRGGGAPIASRDYLDLADYWEDIVDLLERADEGRFVVPLGSARYEIVCVDMMWVGNGDRLPRRRDRGGRRPLYIARVNGNHFVPLKPVGHRRSLRPEPPASQSSCGAAAAALTVHEIDLPPPASSSAFPPQEGIAYGRDGVHGSPAPTEVSAQGGGEGAGDATAGDVALGPAAPPAASAPSGGGERVGRGRRASARDLAAAAAEERARQEDDHERQTRLAIAEHNKRQELEGKVIGAFRARQEQPPFDLGRWPDDRLRETLRRLRGGGDAVECEPTIAALSEAAL